MVDERCQANDLRGLSSPLVGTMSLWGDVAATSAGGDWPGPDGIIDIVTDVISVLEKFSNQPDAPIKARADVAPATVDRVISISDVTFVLDAFRGRPYPFAPMATDPCAP